MPGEQSSVASSPEEEHSRVAALEEARSWAPRAGEACSEGAVALAVEPTRGRSRGAARAVLVVATVSAATSLGSPGPMLNESSSPSQDEVKTPVFRFWRAMSKVP
jgi:hypothetical protein